MFDLISIGDVTIDTYIQIHDAQILCDIDKKNCKLCVEYGKKIPVEKLIHLVAGNAANNAIGGARLGLKTAIYANIGNDSGGEEICRKLKKEAVNSRYIVKNESIESNFSAVISFKGERTIFVYHQPWKYKLPDFDKTRWIYFTSLAQSFIDSNIVPELVSFLQRTGVKLVYNPGTLQIKLGVKKAPQLLSLTEVFIVNKDEAAKILRVSVDTQIKKLLSDIASLGPKKVVITDGAKGSFGLDGKNYFKLGCFPAHVVEMTGAGDAYATGVLAGLFYGKELSEAMRWGAANSAAVVKFIGAEEGLLKYEDMNKILKENSGIIAQVI